MFLEYLKYTWKSFIWFKKCWPWRFRTYSKWVRYLLEDKCSIIWKNNQMFLIFLTLTSSFLGRMWFFFGGGGGRGATFQAWHNKTNVLKVPLKAMRKIKPSMALLGVLINIFIMGDLIEFKVSHGGLVSTGTVRATHIIYTQHLADCYIVDHAENWLIP